MRPLVAWVEDTSEGAALASCCCYSRSAVGLRGSLSQKSRREGVLGETFVDGVSRITKHVSYFTTTRHASFPWTSEGHMTLIQGSCLRSSHRGTPHRMKSSLTTSDKPPETLFVQTNPSGMPPNDTRLPCHVSLPFQSFSTF